MENDAGVSGLMELIFGKQPSNHEEMLTQNSSIYACLKTEDFKKKMGDVLCLKKLIVFYEWQNLFDGRIRDMLSSHEKYLMYVMFACICEHRSNRSIFESFISVCALVIYISEEILKKTGVNLSDLNPDIIMVFYRNVLKRSFHGPKGFHRFVEYIRGHKYLAWNWNRDDLVPSDDPTAPVFIKPDLQEKIMEELSSNHVSREEPNNMKFAMWTTGHSLAREVLSTTSVELAPLPSEPDLIASLVESRKKEIAERKRVEAALHGYSSSNSDSETNYVTEHQDNDVRYENIVQAVISHNHSKSSSNEKANNRIQEEAEEVLEHLKDGIKSLIKIIDEYDKE